MSRLYWTVVMYLLTCCLQSVESLECYQCKDCAVGYESNKRSCPISAPGGMSEIVGLKTKCKTEKTRIAINRGCSKERFNKCDDTKDFGGSTVTTCYCDTDYCNKGSRAKESTLFLGFSFIIMVFFSYE